MPFSSPNSIKRNKRRKNLISTSTCIQHISYYYHTAQANTRHRVTQFFSQEYENTNTWVGFIENAKEKSTCTFTLFSILLSISLSFVLIQCHNFAPTTIHTQSHYFLFSHPAVWENESATLKHLQPPTIQQQRVCSFELCYVFLLARIYILHHSLCLQHVVYSSGRVSM